MGSASDERDELAGRTALITGAGRGLGRAVAEELAQRGALVVPVGRDSERLAEPIDIVVHGDAAFAGYARIEEVDDEEVGRVFDGSLRAALRLTARVFPGMKERGFGRIVFFGSLAGSRGAHGQAAHAAAKAGLEGLMRSVALEGATSGVTANLLELGLIDTEQVREAVDPRALERIVERTPVGRIGLPGEVAEAVAFLVSPRASYITGAVLPVTGGLGLGLYPEQIRGQAESRPRR